MFTYHSETRREPVRLRWVRLATDVFFNMDNGAMIEFSFRDERGNIIPPTKEADIMACLYAGEVSEEEENPYRTFYDDHAWNLYVVLNAEAPEPKEGPEAKTNN